MATNFIQQADPTNCLLTSCQIIDSTTSSTPSYISLTSSTGLSYTFNLDLTNALTANLKFSCTANGGTFNSNNFGFDITCL